MEAPKSILKFGIKVAGAFCSGRLFMVQGEYYANGPNADSGKPRQMVAHYFSSRMR